MSKPQTKLLNVVMFTNCFLNRLCGFDMTLSMCKAMFPADLMLLYNNKCGVCLISNFDLRTFV